jgi:cytochrome c oxidase subunit II
MLLAELPLFPEQASSNAAAVDALLFFLLGVSGFFALLISVLVIYFAVRYRRRPDAPPTPRIEGALRLELFWSVIPLLISLLIFVWGVNLYFQLARPPENALEVYVVGKQWMWKLQHSGGQREINELHVPLGQPLKLSLISEDVIHDFFVPAFRAKVDVVPGNYSHLWFQPTKKGQYHLFCSQYCGTNHSGMIGTVYVQEPAEYQAWLNQRAEGSLALEGRKIFLKFRCTSCHSADAQARAPVLESLYLQRVPLRDGSTVVADETYLRESVLKPDAKIVAGYEAIMPTFQGQINEEEMIRLVAFLKALRPGETPRRVDSAPPPITHREATGGEERPAGEAPSPAKTGPAGVRRN